MDSRTIEQRKAEIDVLMAEYEQATAEVAQWYADWKARNGGYRCVRPQKVSHETFPPFLRRTS